MNLRKIVVSLVTSFTLFNVVAPTGMILASELNNDSSHSKEIDYVVADDQVPTSVTMFQTPDEEWRVLTSDVIQPFATRIVVASRILSVSQVKQMARNIETLNGSGAQALYGLVSGLLPAPYGAIVGASLIASAGSLTRSQILSAARQGKRVRIVITDYKEYHTSYSTQIKYTIIP